MSVTINGTTGITTPDISSVDATFTGTVAGAVPSAIDVNASAPADSLAIDASGNVGIGTTSPSGKFHVVGNETYFQRPSDTVYLRINTANGAADLDAIGGVMRLRYGTSEAMRINSDGRIYFGTSSNIQDGRFTFSGPFSTNRGLSVNTTENGGTAIYFSNQTNGAGYIQINTNNTVSYNTSSDYRLKENVVPMTGALATVAALKPCTYTWIADGSAGQGFIAHELQAVMPDCVSGEKDAVNEDGSIKPQGIDTSFLVATLTAAIQELSAKNDALEARIAALEAQP